MANMEALSGDGNRWQQCLGIEVNELLRRFSEMRRGRTMGKLTKMTARAQGARFRK
jgi:hypothetical protein